MKIPPPPTPDICEYAIGNNGLAIPLVIDLPHSGDVYPADFHPSCARHTLELCEERFLDEIYAAPTLAAGGVVISAKFPRTYVDVNRAITDIDPFLFDTNWPDETDPNGRSIHGHGVIMRLIRQGEPIYNRFLTHDEARSRIEKYYSPYHNMLNHFLNAAHETFGVVYHLNCHSMPSSVLKAHFPYAPPDFILGDKDGRSCGLEFRNHIADILRDMGHRVAVNQLYKGAEIITRYGQPAWGRHSLQMEINRALFQNEDTGEKNKNFNRIQDDINAMISQLKDSFKMSP